MVSRRETAGLQSRSNQFVWIRSYKIFSIARLSSQTNDTTGRSASGVTSLQRVWVATLTQVIGAVMDNNRSADNGVLTEQLDERVLLGSLGNTRGVSGDVTQVTDVSGVVFWSTVVLAKWVEVGTGRGATVGVVTEGVDVETSQGVWLIASDVPRDDSWVGFGGLLESDHATDSLVSSKNGNWGVSNLKRGNLIAQRQ